MRYFFWLLPIEEDRVYYQEIINKLSKRYNGPRFVPHVTIYSGEFKPNIFPEHILNQAILGFDLCTLKVDSLCYTEYFTKTIFIQLHPSHALQKFSSALQAQALSQAEYRLEPHISLLYQSLSVAEKQQIAASIQLSTSHITFDEVSVMTSPTPTRSPEDVSHWREVYRQKLPTNS